MLKLLALLLTVFLGLSAALAQEGKREVRPLAQSDPTLGGGQTYALLIGVSQYEKVRSLEFADKDAELLSEFLKSPLGSVDPANVLLLKNEHATRAAIDDAKDLVSSVMTELKRK